MLGSLLSAVASTSSGARYWQTSVTATTMEIAHVAAFLPLALLVGYVYNPFGARKWNSAKRGGLRGSLPAKDPPPGTTRKEPTCDSNGKTVHDCVAGGYWFTADENGDAVGFPEHHTLDCEEALRALPVSDRPVLWGENRSFALGNFSAGCVGSMCVLEIADTDGQPVLAFGCIIKMHHHLGLLEAEVSALPSASNPLCQCRRELRRSLRTYTHTPHTLPLTFTFTTAPFLLPQPPPPNVSNKCAPSPPPPCACILRSDATFIRTEQPSRLIPRDTITSSCASFHSAFTQRPAAKKCPCASQRIYFWSPKLRTI